MCCSNEAIAEPLHQYRSNAEEADNQIWRHAIQSWATNILIYSPDTDVYNKGFGMIHLVWKLLSKMYLFFFAAWGMFNWISPHSSSEWPRFNFHMQGWHWHNHAHFIYNHRLWLCAFKSLGKAIILCIFYQHTEFICWANMPVKKSMVCLIISYISGASQSFV